MDRRSMKEYDGMFIALYNSLMLNRHTYGCMRALGVIEAYRAIGVNNLQELREMYDRVMKCLEPNIYPSETTAYELCRLTIQSIDNKVPSVFENAFKES
jgi:hypothetical protein